MAWHFWKFLYSYVAVRKLEKIAREIHDAEVERFFAEIEAEAAEEAREEAENKRLMDEIDPGWDKDDYEDELEKDEIDPELIEYIETKILPQYDNFDAAHRRDHVEMVIKQSLEIVANNNYHVFEEMVLVIAAFHDLGLSVDRKTHHLESGRILREDPELPTWFSDLDIETMAQAVEDHRASSDHEPRSIYGKIVAEADRYIDPEKIIERTIQYGLEHYPELDKEGHWKRAVDHLQEKYAEGGYLKLYLPESPNASRLEELRKIIRDKTKLRSLFDNIYKELTE